MNWATHTKVSTSHSGVRWLATSFAFKSTPWSPHVYRRSRPNCSPLRRRRDQEIGGSGVVRQRSQGQVIRDRYGGHVANRRSVR